MLFRFVPRNPAQVCVCAFDMTINLIDNYRF